MALYKIRHAIAAWTHEDGTPGQGFRNQVVEIPDNEAERLKNHFAIIGPDEEVEHPGILQDLPTSPSDEEILGWISNANASEVRALIATRPELAPRVEGALTSVKAARAYEDQHLNDIRLAIQRGGLKTDEIMLGSGAVSGHDTTDTSGDSDDSDIIVTSLNPAGASTEPPAGGAGVQGGEPNTGLKDANGNPDGLPPVDHAVLVQGTGQDVANYVGAHPEQAAAILEAETVHTEGSPRAEVVKAVRAASGFTN
jgi:hypothetical protein